jgi:hypothetical protein
MFGALSPGQPNTIFGDAKRAPYHLGTFQHDEIKSSSPTPCFKRTSNSCYQFYDQRRHKSKKKQGVLWPPLTSTWAYKPAQQAQDLPFTGKESKDKKGGAITEPAEGVEFDLGPYQQYVAQDSECLHG